MKNLQQINRRNFFQLASLSAGAVVAFSMLPSALGADHVLACPATKITSVISKNHGHELLISLEELKASGAKSYSIKGASGHFHTVDISDDVLLALFLKSAVEIETTVDAGHSHVMRLEIISK